MTLLFLLVFASSFSQANDEIKAVDEMQFQTLENSLAHFTDDLIKGIPHLKNAELVKIIVNDVEIKNPEKYKFDIVDLLEMSLVRNENIEKDESRTSYSIDIKTGNK